MKLQRLMLVKERRDFNRPSKLIALDLIWAFTGYRIRENKIEFLSVKELDHRPDIPDDENTFARIEIDGTEDTRFSGNKGFMYRRLPLNEIPGASDLVLIVEGPTFTLSDVLDQINDYLQTQLTTDDLDDSKTYDSNIRLNEIKASPGSLAWVDSISFKVTRLDHDGLFGNAEIDGFHQYQGSDYMTDKPYLGLSNQRLVGLINESNETQYELGADFVFGSLRPVSRDDYRNTSIIIVPADPDIQPEAVYYRRLSLAVFNAIDDSIPPVKIPSVPTTTHEILDIINAMLGINLQPSEVENIRYDAFSNRLRLKIASEFSSVAWVESHYDFKVELPFDINLLRATQYNRLRGTQQGTYRLVAIDPNPPVLKG